MPKGGDKAGLLFGGVGDGNSHKPGSFGGNAFSFPVPLCPAAPYYIHQYIQVVIFIYVRKIGAVTTFSRRQANK